MPTLAFDLLTSNKMGDHDLSRTIHLPSLMMICPVFFCFTVLTNTYTHTYRADKRPYFCDYIGATTQGKLRCGKQNGEYNIFKTSWQELGWEYFRQLLVCMEMMERWNFLLGVSERCQLHIVLVHIYMFQRTPGTVRVHLYPPPPFAWLGNVAFGSSGKQLLQWFNTGYATSCEWWTQRQQHYSTPCHSSAVASVSRLLINLKQ